MDSQSIRAAVALIHPEWKKIVLKPRDELADAIAGVNRDMNSRSGVLLRPDPVNIFRAFWGAATDIKTVLVGQDPYPNANACGLAFSSTAWTPSLRAICKVVNWDTPDLTSWAERVLLLNTALTTADGCSAAHSNHWMKYTRELVSAISAARPDLVWILLGSHAHRLGDRISAAGAVFRWCHPSPLCCVTGELAFKYCPSFRLAAEHWEKHGVLMPWAAVETTGETAGKSTGETANQPTSETTGEPNYEHKGALPGCVIFTDGACKGNGTSAAVASWAFVVCQNGSPVVQLAGVVEPVDTPGKVHKSSNQRGELTAVLRALEWLRDNLQPALIVSDSEYSIKTLTEWAPKWLASKWAKAANVDLIKPALELVRHTGCTWRHQRSHQKKPSEPLDVWLWEMNNLADGLATTLINS